MARIGPPVRLTYGVSADEAHRFGLPRRGTLELLVERDPAFESLKALVSRLQSGSLLSRRVDLSDGRVTLANIVEPQKLEVAEGHVVNTFGPEYRMLLIGAGQLAEYLATMTASQIASASAASFSFVLTYGFTNWGAISRTV